MNDQDLEKLSLFLDGALPPEEAAQVAHLVASDPEWKAAHKAMKITGEMLRAPVESTACQANFDQLWRGIEAGLPAPTPAVPGLWERLRGLLSPPVLVGLAAAAAVAAYVASRPVQTPGPASAPASGHVAVLPAPGSAALAASPVPASETSEPVVIEGIESEGSKTVLVSQPVEPTGTTVIWLLDGPDAAPAQGAATPAVDDDDDPI